MRKRTEVARVLLLCCSCKRKNLTALLSLHAVVSPSCFSMDLKSKSVEQVGLWLDEEGFNKETVQKFKSKCSVEVVYLRVFAVKHIK